MPRIIMGQDQEPRPVYPDLVTALAAELQYNRPTGQPVIREQRFPQTEAIRTTVIWDRWEHLTDEQRVEVILQAYEEVEGEAFRNRLALAIGLTVPEAHDAGLLPFEVITALRTTDTVSPEQCKQASNGRNGRIGAFQSRETYPTIRHEPRS